MTDELESHAELPEVGVAQKLPDVVHRETYEHVEGHKCYADDESKEHAVGDNREGHFFPILIPFVSKT